MHNDVLRVNIDKCCRAKFFTEPSTILDWAAMNYCLVSFRELDNLALNGVETNLSFFNRLKD